MQLTALESVLNRNIAGSSAAWRLCKRLDGHVLAVHLTGISLSLYFSCSGERVAVHTSHEGRVHATLSGSPLSFLRMAATDAASTLRGGAVQIQGDAEIAQAFGELLHHARPDIEEELSLVIGDVAAHQAGNVARSILGFGQRARAALVRNLAEYLQEERRDLPTRLEADEFNSSVDKLRDDVARLEAKLNLLGGVARRE